MTLSKTIWRPQPRKVILKNNEVHVWCSSLTLKPEILNKLRLILSTDEIERADRFHSQKDQFGFIAGRGILRSILGYYLQIEPSEIRFTYNTHGKPSIANITEASGLNFNISHSHELALYALTRGRGIGIDIERLRSNLSFERIAKRFFPPAEFEKLRSLPPEEFVEGFFNFWTCKEAYIKAIGKGLSIPLNQFAVTVHANKTVKIQNSKTNHCEESRWSFYTLRPAPGYVGALTVEGKKLRIKYWMWSE